MKKLFKKYCFLIILIFSIININIPMPISDNGTLQVAIIELFFPIIIMTMFILILKKKIVLNDEYKKICKYIIIFLIIYALISLFRIIMNYEYKQSLLAIKVTIFPMILLFFARYVKIDKEHILKNLIIFEFIINCIQLTNYSNFRMSSFLGNIMVYLSIIEMLFIINVFVLTKNKYSITIKFCSIINLLMTFIVPLMAGSRSSFYITCILFICTIIYCLIIKKIKTCCLLILLVILGIGFNIYSFENYRNYIGMHQSRIFPSLFNTSDNIPDNISIDIPIIENIPNEENNNTISEPIIQNEIIPIIDNTIIEKIKSDNIRQYLVDKSIASIKKSPLIGEGIIYYNVNTDYGVSQQTAHNFILEYINSYGLIGFIFYLAIHFQIIANILKKSHDINIYFLIFLTIPPILVQSLVQPTMLIVPIVTIYYTLYSLYLGWSEVYE